MAVKKTESVETSVKTGTSSAKKEKLVYVGPTIPGVITKGVVLNGNVPKKYTELMSKYGYLKNLLVKLGDVNRANQEIGHRAGAYYEFYKKANEIAKEAK